MAHGGEKSLLLAQHYHDLDQWEKALRALSDAGSEELESDGYWFVRADSLRHLGRFDEAIETARAGLTRSPDNVGLLDSLGLSLAEQGNLEAGNAVFEAALAIAPEQPYLLGHHAVALAKLKRLDEADRVVAELQQVAPGSLIELEVRAQVAYLGKKPTARSTVDELLAADPENRVGHVLRGNLALRSQSVKPAAAAFAEAALLNPSNRSVARAARHTKVASHPLLAPTRLFTRLGRGRPRVLYFVVVIALLALNQQAIAFAFVAIWVVFMGVLPRVLRARYERQHGEL